MTSPAQRLRTIRDLHRARAESTIGSSLAFAVYIGALLVLFLVLPVLVGVIALLAEPMVISRLSAPSAGRVFAVVCGFVVFAASLSGSVRGPVAPSPFFVVLLAETDIPRRRGLLRPFVTSVLGVISAGLIVSVVVGGVLVHANVAQPVATALFTLGCGSYAILVSMVWLTSQRLSRQKWILPTAALAATLLTAMVEPLALFTSWGWVGLLWPATESAPLWPLFLLGGLTVVAALTVPRLLDGLDSESLREQGQRWRGFSTAVEAGDFGTALAGLRAKPAVGRRWRAVAQQPTGLRFLQRDLIGTLRAPGRFFAGAGFLILAFWVSALAFAQSSWPAWLPAGLGAALVHLALGVFCDGLRHAAETAASPPMYRYTTAQLYLLHSLLPLTLSLICAGAGLAFAIGMGVPVTSAGAIALIATMAVVIRAFDGAKGSLPTKLLMPTSTPVGDISGLLILVWQADALIIAAVSGAVIGSGFSAGDFTPALGSWVLVITVLIFLFLRRRLQQL